MTHIAVIGAGRMSSGIAQLAAAAGVNVVLTEELVSHGIDTIARLFQ